MSKDCILVDVKVYDAAGMVESRKRSLLAFFVLEVRARPVARRLGALVGVVSEESAGDADLGGLAG